MLLHTNNIAYLVFFAYALVTSDKATLFVEPSQISEDVKQYLQAEGVTIDAYDKVIDVLSVFAKPVRAAVIFKVPRTHILTGSGSLCRPYRRSIPSQDSCLQQGLFRIVHRHGRRCTCRHRKVRQIPLPNPAFCPNRN